MALTHTASVDCYKSTGLQMKRSDRKLSNLQ